MVKTKTVKTKADLSKAGIHIFNPTKKQLKDAKERAKQKGFSTVWIHKKRGY